MFNEAAQFEKDVKKRLEEFHNPELKKRKKPVACVSDVIGLQVELAVRPRAKGAANYPFFHTSDSLSRDIAVMEARSEAHKAGWGHVAYTVDIVTLRRGV